MKKLILVTFLISISGNSFAAEKCQVKSVFNMVAFGADFVKGKNLSANGSIGSGNDIHLLNSDIQNSDCRALSSNGNVTINDSRVNGSIESFGKLTIIKSEVKGQVRSPNKIELIDSSAGIAVSPKGLILVNSSREKWWTSSIISSIDLNKFKNDVILASKKYAALPKSENLKLIVYKDNLTLSLKNKDNVVSLTSEQLAKIKNLEIRGNVEQTLVINVVGDVVSLDHNIIDISGDIEPFNIVWNFHQAKSVMISENSDQVLGVPGRVLAPNANVKLENALISGGIYAKSIEFNSTGENSASQLREIIREIKYQDK
jgi:choice-of-anchor A domain-containing protein